MITYNDEKKPKRRRNQFRNYQTGVITGSMRVRNRISNGATYLVLIILNIIALTPLVYLVGQSFRAESGAWSSTFFPKTWTLANYKRLFTQTPFLRWYGNTFFVAVISCAITTTFVLAVSYAFSRIRFRMRRPMMNVMLVLGMFPGFMSMTAVYFLLKILLPNNFQSLASLIIVYSSGAALSYYVAKGFFDTVPKSLDEAAFIDGATRAQIFWKITIPLSKPIVIVHRPVVRLHLRVVHHVRRARCRHVHGVPGNVQMA